MKGYTKEDIKSILGSSWPTMPEDHETGNQLRRRKGQEMREGKRPYPKYPSRESRIADTSGKFELSNYQMLCLSFAKGFIIGAILL